MGTNHIAKLQSARAGRGQGLLQCLTVTVIMLAFLAQLALGSRHLSMTSDEPPHLINGYVILTTGDLWAVPSHGHPPLLNAWSAWLILLQPERPYPPDVSGWHGDAFSFYVSEMWPLLGPIERLAFITRAPIMLLAVVLIALVYRWARNWFGHWGGVLAILAMAWDPTMVAHSQLDTTDLGTTLFIFASLYLMGQLLRHPSWRLSIGIGLTLGATMASKASGVILAPVVMALLVWGYLRDTHQGWRQVLSRRADAVTVRALLRTGGWWAGYAAVVGVVGILFLWSVYGFEWRALPGMSNPIPLASHIRMLQAVLKEQSLRTSFLWGVRKEGGAWWYFPFAFAIKTPLPLIVSIITALFMAVRQGRHWLQEEITLWLFPVVYAVTAMQSDLNIGYRHLLPIFPFVYTGIARLTNRLKSRQPRWRHAMRWIAITFGVWYVVGTLSVYPFAIAYFNELIGGARNGYRYLVDSNVDWGQSFKALKTWMDQTSVKKVWLSYYTYIDPAVYGVSNRPLYPAPNTEPILVGRLDPPPRVYAISATVLQGMTYFPDLYDWFRHQEPTAQPGYGLLVYRVPPHDPPGRWVAQCTAPQAPLNDQILEEGFGRNDLRQILFDCTNSWVYPDGGRSSGWYAFHRDTWLHGDDFLRKQLAPTHLTYQQTWYYDEPPFAMFQWNGSDTLPSPWASARVRVAPSTWTPARVEAEAPVRAPPIRFSGPLTFLGYQLLSPTENRLELTTVWQAEAAHSRPLALTARVTRADSLPLASSEGPGVPANQWQAGDILVQRHQWETPDGLRPGPYWIQVGVYWRDTQESWQALVDGSAAGDQLLLPSEAERP